MFENAVVQWKFVLLFNNWGHVYHHTHFLLVFKACIKQALGKTLYKLLLYICIHVTRLTEWMKFVMTCTFSKIRYIIYIHNYICHQIWQNRTCGEIIIRNIYTKKKHDNVIIWRKNNYYVIYIFQAWHRTW